MRLLSLLLLLCALGVHATDDHLLITEAVLTPTSDEYIEIHNPTGAAIALDDYYLSDDADYALLPGAFGAGPAPSIGDFDFIAQFPVGATIAAGETLVVAFSGAGFFGTFGFAADFEILADDAGTPDMIATNVGASAGLTNSGEHAVLFYWDGASDLVQDVDIAMLGTPSATNDVADKTGITVDGPDMGKDASAYVADAKTIPQQMEDPGSGFSTKRILAEAGNEMTGGGNGITGDDETSEDISMTWDTMFTAPDPGVYNPGVPLPNVFINEVDADTEGSDALEFVELFGAPNASLDGLVMVFYNGSSDTSYNVFDLDGQSLDANGFFVVGNDGVAQATLNFPDNGLQNGADAVALYVGDDTDFPNGTAVTDENLVDALVYDTNDGDDSGLIDVLTPGQAQINEDALGNKDFESISRVPDGGTRLDTSTFVTQEPTPGATNVLPEPVVVVINEVDADTPGSDAAEFVELFGTPNGSLDGLVVVFFNGSSDTSYLALDLDGQSLDANGFFVLGNAATPNVDLVFADNGLQNGADAVALYNGDDTDFPNGTAVTDTGLIDALVYDTNDSDDSGLIDVLTPGQAQLNEDENGNKDTESNSRVPDGGMALDTSTYVAQEPTPGATNVAAAPTEVVINEVDADTPGNDEAEFVELFGTPNGSLDGLVIVLFNGSSDTSYLAVDLDGQSLNANGFFVLGNANTPNVDVLIPDNSLQNGADAVALFTGDDTDFPNGTAVTAMNLVDALVYDTNDSDDSGLIDVLTPGQPQINEDTNKNKDADSISRVPDGGMPLDTTSYMVQEATPGASNVMGAPPVEVVINELDADQSGTDAGEFVELFGAPNTDLSGLVIVFFNGSDNASYEAFDLDGQSLDANGFFVLGNAAVANVDLVFSDNSLQNGADAVAVFQGDATDFPNDTPVTDVNLIDAVVYDTDDNDDTDLLNVLTPGQPQVDERGNDNGSFDSIARVPDGGAPRNTSTYVAQLPTPGESNVTPPSVVINELDADTSGTDTQEFIELIGAPGTALDGVVVVLFNGSSDTSYAAFDLDGRSLDENGLFVLGNTAVTEADFDIGAENIIQNGADAAAVYFADATDFPNGTPVTADGLLDALVYGTNDSDDSGLLDVLTPGQVQVNESSNGNNATESNSRVPDGGAPFDSSVYSQQTPTPGAFNSITAIADIQGNGFTSPLADSSVQTRGIVTGLASNGFTMQTPDAEADDDADTSEGIFVFTGGAPAVAEGDDVTVVGTVEEFFDLTQVALASFTINSNGNPLPTPVELDETNPSPVQPQDPLTFERLEGMLVRIASGVVTGPNQGFGSDPIAEIHITAADTRSFREPGIEFPGEKGLPIWDGNPEVFEMDIDRLGLPSDAVVAGTSFTDAVGVIGYEFGDYELWAKQVSFGTRGATVTARPVRDIAEGELAVGSQNLLRLFTNNGNYQDRLAKFSLLVRDVLKAPQILAVQEAGGEQPLLDLAARIAADDPSLNYTVHISTTNDFGGTFTAFMVRDGVTVNNLSQIDADLTFPWNGNDQVVHDRPPLVLEATFDNGVTSWDVVVVNLHNRSLNGIDDPTSIARTKRDLQGKSIAAGLQDIQTQNPGVNLLVLGDFNAFEFTDGYVDLMGQITGNPDPLGALFPATDLVEPDLFNHTTDLEPAERYSFNFGGNAQTLDHVLSSSNLTPLVRGVEYGRAASDYADVFEDDAATPLRASDHDGLVAFIEPAGFSVTPTALNTDELGGNDVFSVVLDAAPSEDVTIDLMVDDPSEVILDAEQLIFTAANWDTPQDVVVTGIGDLLLDGDQTVNITSTATSDAPDFDGLTGDVVVVDNEDAEMSEDFTVLATPGQPIVIVGTPGATVGLYVLDGDGNWVYLEDVVLDENGQGTASTVASGDAIYGAGGIGGAFPPTTGTASVPTLGEWGLIFFVMLLAAAAMVMNRKRRLA